jgi:hypothetical protein
MAEGARFELADPLRGLRFSRPARSAAPSPLRASISHVMPMSCIVACGLSNSVRLRLGCGFTLHCRHTCQIVLGISKPMDVMPIVSLKPMGVYIERDTDTTMTKLLLDACDMRSLPNEAGIGVATAWNRIRRISAPFKQA